MLVYFNEYGQLLEYLEYDSVARVGATDFRIFAYFSGLEDYTLATIASDVLIWKVLNIQTYLPIQALKKKTVLLH